jgi:hypothetical protein
MDSRQRMEEGWRGGEGQQFLTIKSTVLTSVDLWPRNWTQFWQGAGRGKWGNNITRGIVTSRLHKVLLD